METFPALLVICAGDLTGPRWIPRTKASDAELWCFLICVWINGWVNNHEAGDLRRYRTPLWHHCNVATSFVSPQRFDLYIWGRGSALHWYLISWFFQCWSRRFLKLLKLGAFIISDGKLFNVFVILLRKKYLLLFWLDLGFTSLRACLVYRLGVHILNFLCLRADLGTLLDLLFCKYLICVYRIISVSSITQIGKTEKLGSVFIDLFHTRKHSCDSPLHSFKLFHVFDCI